jgi:hypothetical protein
MVLVLMAGQVSPFLLKQPGTLPCSIIGKAVHLMVRHISNPFVAIRSMLRSVTVVGSWSSILSIDQCELLLDTTTDTAAVHNTSLLSVRNLVERALPSFVKAFHLFLTLISLASAGIVAVFHSASDLAPGLPNHRV